MFRNDEKNGTTREKSSFRNYEQKKALEKVVDTGFKYFIQNI